MGVYLVERYWPGVTKEVAIEAAVRVRKTAETMATEGAAVRWLSSSLIVSDEAVFTFFEASSDEVVAEANLRAKLPVDRISFCLQVPSEG